MPLEVDSVRDLQLYLQGVADRADHHAEGVKHTALLLAGIVILLHDADARITVHKGKDGPGNVLWFVAKGARYALSYAHEVRKIELRSGSVQGEVLGGFNDLDPASSVLERVQDAIGRRSR